MNPSTTSRVLLATIVLVSGIGLTASPANAAILRGEVADVGVHCVVGIMPDQSENPGAMTPQQCFPTFSAAIFFATGGAVLVDEQLSPTDLTQEMLEDVPESHTVLSVDYVDSNYGGLSLTWTGHGDCSASLTYSAGSMPAGWNDIVSSALTYANCNRNTHYEHSNWGGASLVCACASMGVMNDQTSSERWST
jgi:hypothetical protein